MHRTRSHDSTPYRWRSGDARRLGAVLLLILCATATAAESGKFDALHTAARALEDAAARSASYDRFSELARALATEIVAANDKTESDEERALFLLYARVGLAYGDGLSLWREKLRAESSNMLSAAAANVEPLVARYRIRAAEDGRIDADAAIRQIWTAAQSALRKAELLQQGRTDELIAVLDAEAQATADSNEESGRAAVETAHQRTMMERIAAEFDEAERQLVRRPAPYEVSPGNWTCPRGYVVRRGKCLGDDDVARLPKVEIGR